MASSFSGSVSVRSSLALALVALASPAGTAQLKTTVQDFHQPGTQPNALNVPIATSGQCALCHAGFDVDQEPYTRWSASMMAQSARDPVFHAALAIANQDAVGAGEMCLRCHSPAGWLGGHSTPTDGSALSGTDFEGVTCHVCHRMVDPVADPANPLEDQAILAGLAELPITPGTGQYVIDPDDRRRGPFDLGPNFPWHMWAQSPFHQESALCGTCHDVSNPAMDRVGGLVPAADDTYRPNRFDRPHPTQNKFDQFPVERTYSEWASSAFAQGPIDLGGKFGGNKTAVSSCQDCHMPDTDGVACAPGFGGTQRSDLPLHDFNGVNSWVLKAILRLDVSELLYDSAEGSFLTQEVVDDALARNVKMLEDAAELELFHVDGQLRVRIVNDSGHKLPTGYGEGRRMWIRVAFRDARGRILKEHGAYDLETAELDEASTKVYEIHQGLDAAMAQLTGQPAGASFHFVLNNAVLLDNRIPPRGFTNAGFEAVQAKPVGYDYVDGQYWDDTSFEVPRGAVSADVEVYHQTTSKEYIEFLRDANHTNNRGRIAYDEWRIAGRSAPVRMDAGTIDFGP